eukprot:2783323-Pyramimonas_sp.AAC.1
MSSDDEVPSTQPASCRETRHIGPFACSHCRARGRREHAAPQRDRSRSSPRRRTCRRALRQPLDGADGH